MAYQTYITEALVCGGSNSHSADRSFLLFTREGGMVYAHAKSVREERSKQRYALQDFSHVRVTLIRGKSGWKVAGVESIQNLYALATTREERTFIRNIIRLLKRVIHGETAHGEIFDDIIRACARPKKEFQEKLESILTLRILHTLGYVAPVVSLHQFFHCVLPFDTIESLDETKVTECREIIEHALMQSQL